MHIALPKACADILQTLVNQGYQAYIVGGCVRDSLLHTQPHDWDICTDALPDDIIRIFKQEVCHLAGLKHGTVTVQASDKELYEITTFRKDGKYSDGRHPDSVQFVSDLKEDLARRDFTINAMAYSHDTGIIDPFGGQADLQAKLIRCVGNPEERFEEDHLRLLRAIRFAAQLGFTLEANTADAIMELASRVHLAAPERIGVEFFKTVNSPYAATVFRSAAGRRMLKTIAPIFQQMDGCEQHNQYHCADVFEHTMLALENSWTCHDFPDEWADAAVRMALLLHDTGKPSAKFTDENGHDHFYGHPKQSAEIAKAVLRNLRYETDVVNSVVKLVEYHDVAFMPTKAHTKRLLNRFGEHDLYRLLKIREADNRAHAEKAFALFEERDAPMPALIAEVLAEESAFSIKHLAVNGWDIMQACCLKPGKQVGDILNQLLQDVIDEKIPNEKEALLTAAQAMQSHK